MSLALPYRVVLFAGLLLAVWTLFWQLSVLLLAVLLTVIVALPLTAVTDWLQRHHVPRPVGAIGTVLLALAAVAAFGYLIAPTLATQAERAIAEIPTVVQRVREQLGLAANAETARAGFEIQAFVQSYLDDPTRLAGRVRNVLTTALAFFGGILLVLLTAIYAAINPRPLVDGMIRLVPPEGRRHAEQILCRLRESWLGWLKGAAVDMLLTGALTYAALSVLGLEHALVFALLTALLEVVPYFGPILAAIPPVLYALTQSVELALLTLAVYTLIQQIEGNVIVPLVMSKAVQLHPALLAIGVVVIGQLFGLMGVLLAVPILTALVVLVQELWILPREDSARGQQRRRDDSAPPDDATRGGLSSALTR
ncbi:MAG: AI-2E family transporter [Actinobacteria bacterium]|nr:AI-2E family transporter [Actinomycetota bacterium]